MYLLRLFAISFLVYLPSQLFAQSSQNDMVKVVLKNGNVIVGELVKMDQDSMVIEVSKKLIRLSMKEVETFQKGSGIQYLSKNERFIRAVEEGKTVNFFTNFRLGVMPSFSSFEGLSIGGHFDAVLGIAYKKRFFAGVGSGIFVNDYSTFVPLNLNLQYSFLKKAISPFIAVSAGTAYDIVNPEFLMVKANGIYKLYSGINFYPHVNFGLQLNIGIYTHKYTLSDEWMNTTISKGGFFFQFGMIFGG